jgi:3-hydroxyisobutyrate dehydrogenase-like beta-hydroxyacid dehydrogenase
VISFRRRFLNENQQVCFHGVGRIDANDFALATVESRRRCGEVVSAGGANSAMFQMMMPWALEGDDSRLRGPFRIGGKDLRTYCRLAEAAPFAAFMAQAASQTYQLVNARGHGDRMIPTLPGILAELNGAKIRDLDP